MKNFTRTSKAAITLICLTFILSSCSSWRYNSPRVKVDIDRAPILVIENKDKAEETTMVMDDAKTTAAIPTYLETTPINNVKTKNTVVKERKTFQLPVMNQINERLATWKTKTITSHADHKNHVNQVKESNKTAMSLWFRLMIIFLVIALILFVLGAVLWAFFGGGLWWIFYTFAGIFVVAAIVMLIIGLLGLL